MSAVGGEGTPPSQTQIDAALNALQSSDLALKGWARECLRNWGRGVDGYTESNRHRDGIESTAPNMSAPSEKVIVRMTPAENRAVGGEGTPRHLIELLQELPPDARLCVFLNDEVTHPVTGVHRATSNPEDDDGLPIRDGDWWLIA